MPGMTRACMEQTGMATGGMATERDGYQVPSDSIGTEYNREACPESKHRDRIQQTERHANKVQETGQQRVPSYFVFKPK